MLPKELEHEERPEIWEQILKLFLFPFLLKYRSYICFLWFILFIICVIYGPSFLSKTRSDLDVPGDTPSAKAIKAFKLNYPEVSTWPPSFIVSHTTDADTDIINYNSFTYDLSVALNEWASDYDVVSSVGGYWEYVNSIDFLAHESISSNNRTMLTTIYYDKDATLDDIDVSVAKLIKFADSHTSSAINVKCTGIFPLFHEMSDATEENFAMIDGIVLPIAIIILGTQVKSYRHMFVALVNLLCTLLLAFAWLVPISDSVAINPFAPSIMMSLGIAISFDYSLFMLTRFREEIIENNKSTEDAVYSALLLSGHVVILSGCTLFVTFALLIGFPQNFLQSVGWGCGAIIISAIFCNLTITPTLLLTFQCFSVFELYPPCCVQGCQRKETIEYKGVENNQQVIPTDSTNEKKQVEVEEEQRGKSNEGVEVVVEKEVITTPRITPRTWWFRVSYFTSTYSRVILLIVAGVTIPFIIEFLKMVPTSDDELVYLRGSNSLEALQTLKSDFPMGQMDPYSVILTTDISYGVLTSDYFTYETGLISEILSEEQPKYIDTSSISALSYYNGAYVDYDTSMAYFNTSSPVYNDSIAVAYRIEVGSSLNSDSSASLIRIETIINPNSQKAEGFVVDMRRILDKYESKTAYGSTYNQVKLYLFGAYTTTLDVQDALYATVPTLIGCTIAIVMALIFFSFGSIMIAVRLAITVFVSLSWTYGLMVYVYQPGPSQDDFAVLNPALSTSTGIYWIIPIMSFSILVGLALDYDIFLMSRVVEFRKLGWSDRASICLSIEKTGSIITAAGVIMSVSFAGLLLPKSTVLNQYGFSLFVGVMLDTFIVRSVVVPVIFTALDTNLINQFNWYPTVMPEVLLSAEEEEKQLFAGYWEPQVEKKEMVVTDEKVVELVQIT